MLTETLYLIPAKSGFCRAPAQGQLFQALRTNRLIAADAGWQDIRYSRCGRTDKGVSGLGQVLKAVGTLYVTTACMRS